MQPAHHGFRLHRWLRHLLQARGRYSTHSPRLYQWLTAWRKAAGAEESALFDQALRRRRQSLRRRRDRLIRTDFGATGRQPPFLHRSWPQEMRLETRPVWMHRFWYRMVGWQQPRQLVEVGTAAGLSTAALAAGAPSGAELFALEGDSKLRGIAEATCRELADRLSAEVSFFGGVAEDVLPDLRPELTQLDAAFLDALATEAFLDRLGPMLLEVLSSGGFLAIPDIYRSPGAERAWGRLAGHPRVNAAWDFYHFGLLWTDPDLTPGYRRVYLGLLPGMAL